MGRFSKLETNGSASTAEESSGSLQPVSQTAKAAAPEVEYDSSHYLSEGDGLFYRGQYQKALRLYSRAIQADHSLVEPWVGQVLCLIEMKQLGEAMVWVKRALELFPEDARIVSLEAVVYAYRGMVQRGLGASDYAIKIDASDPLVWFLRAQILCMADNRNYQFCLDKAMEMRHPEDWKLPMLVGQFMLRQKRWAQAVENLKMAVAANARNPFAWRMLGQAYEKMALTQAALDAYHQAEELDTTGLEARSAIQRLTTTPLLVRLIRRLFG